MGKTLTASTLATLLSVGQGAVATIQNDPGGGGLLGTFTLDGAGNERASALAQGCVAPGAAFPGRICRVLLQSVLDEPTASAGGGLLTWQLWKEVNAVDFAGTGTAVLWSMWAGRPSSASTSTPRRTLPPRTR